MGGRRKSCMAAGEREGGKVIASVAACAVDGMTSLVL